MVGTCLHWRFEIKALKLVLDARVMNLESYGANPTSGFIRENDNLGRLTARCARSEWTASHLRYTGRLVGHDLAL